MQELVQFLLLRPRQGEGLPSREFGIRLQVYCMVPGLLWGQLVKGLLREYVSEVLVLLWH
jgi:hypothetical protein